MVHFAAFTFILLFIPIGQSMKVSFCDGDKLVTIKDKQCPGGVNFGARKPDCVCISGIYRMWMDNCVVFDGFMEGGCSTLTQETWEVVGLRLTGKVRHLSNSTAVVYASKENDYQTWSAYPIGGNSSTAADNFYTINGIPYVIITTSHKKTVKSICIQRQVKSSDQICRYYRTDDDAWSTEDGELPIIVMDNCDPPFGSKKIALKSKSCYGIIGKDDSECSLPCAKNGELDIIRIDPNSASSEDETSNKLFKRDSENDNGTETSGETTKSSETEDDAKKDDDETKTDDGEDNGEDGDSDNIQTKASKNPQRVLSSTPIEFNNIDEANITSLSITQQLDENNFFLNRKLNHYSKLRQVGYLQPNDLRQIKPSRTFELLDILKDIGKRACPNRFVSSLFIDQAVDLFVILHKGRNYRYTEDLGESDFEWIRRILSSCLIDMKEIEMFQEKDEFSDKCTDFQKVKGVCEKPGVNCTDLTITESHSNFGKYHFVVEAAWDLIDLAQIACFPAFTESYRMFHQWEQASEKLFTREIRKLWYNPNLSLKVYQNLLTPSAQIDMYNLEMCVEGAYTINPSLTRLNRPTEPRRFFRRKKREADTIIPTKQVDVFCRKTEPEFEYPC